MTIEIADFIGSGPIDIETEVLLNWVFGCSMSLFAHDRFFAFDGTGHSVELAG
jgi:hypothetical protein